MLEYFIASILTLLVTLRVNAEIQFFFVWPNEVWVDEMSDGLTGSQVMFLMYLSVKIINTTCIVVVNVYLQKHVLELKVLLLVLFCT